MQLVTQLFHGSSPWKPARKTQFWMTRREIDRRSSAIRTSSSKADLHNNFKIKFIHPGPAAFSLCSFHLHN